ncbi:ABC transporter permease [Rhizobium jaguaris]|nr:ABC transporter permease [Rhizobium jaguaris]
MLRMIVTRIPQMIVVILIVTIIAFVMVNLLPGDIVSVILGDQYTPEAAAQLTQELSLDQPVPIRYLIWLWRAVHLDFGTSLATHVSVVESMLQDALPTLELVIGAMVSAVILGSALAIGAVASRNPWIDRAGTALALFCTSLPNFILALIVTTIFGVQLHIIPTIGWADPGDAGWGANIGAIIMPSIILGLTIFPSIMRIFRSELQEQLESEEYVTLARMKGVTGWGLIWRHVARNSAFGLITVVAAGLGPLVSGAVILENIFAIPGLGTLLFQGIQLHDSPVVVGCVTVVAVIVVLSNLGADLVYAALDPRVRDALNS